MSFRKQLQCVAFGCFCTLAGVLLSSSVLPLFSASGEDVIYEHIMCKSLAVLNDNDEPIALLGEVGDGNYGTLTLIDNNRERALFASNSKLIFTTNGQEVIELSVLKDSGRLLLKSSKNSGLTVIGEKEDGFAIGVFGSKGSDIGAGASLSIENNKGQLFLFGENEDMLFGRGSVTYGQ